jgi:D-alanine-D-alanine ligase
VPVTLRDVVSAEDLAAVREIVSSTGFFTPDELDVAIELVEDHLARGEASGYYFLFAEQDGQTVGYACYGPIACTVGSFDLYWIAVHRDYWQQGLGRLLLRAAERRIAAAGGRRIYIETAGKPEYAPTRKFYERCGYVAEASLADFYAPGDAKIIYSRAIGPGSDLPVFPSRERE